MSPRLLRCSWFGARTLTGDEADHATERVLARLGEKVGAVLRS
jgi:hypothetical protein